MKQRDLELLSSYLDGQLSPSDSARLESRLASDPNLRAVMDDLREARSLLRRLPSRKAPRNFTLTRKMVGQNPPMPRAYPVFRFVTTIATLLLCFTVGLNFLAPQMASQAPTFGMGGGGGDTELFAEQATGAAATEPPAIEAPATEAPAIPSAELVPMPTDTLSVEDSERIAETPAEKNGLAQEPAARDEAQDAAPFVPSTWQVVLAGIVVIGASLMILMRQLAINRWRR
jgi:anti-sigma factor RsiW